MKKLVYLILAIGIITVIASIVRSRKPEANTGPYSPRAKRAIKKTMARYSDKIDWTELHTAAVLGDLDEVKQLLANGADINRKDNAGWTPLRMAAFYGFKEVAEFLIASGADVNVKDIEGYTPLHMAVLHPEIVKLLLSNGADVNSKNKDGETPLMLAQKLLQTKMAKPIVGRQLKACIDLLREHEE